MSAEETTLPTGDALCGAIKGVVDDGPLAAAIAAMHPLHQQRYLSISILVDEWWCPLPVKIATQAAERRTAAISETTRHIHAIDQHIAATAQLDPSPDAEEAEYTIGEFAAQIGYVALIAYIEREAGQNDRRNEARLAALFYSYDKFRADLLSGASRLPQRLERVIR